MKRVAIVGAGLAGLAAAQALQQRNIQVTVYEKSRGVGGRAATRRINGCIIDHGAQVAQAPTPALQQLFLAEAGEDLPAAQEIARPIWVFDAAGTIEPGNPEQNAQPRWCWPAGMTTLGKRMAAGIPIHYQTHVQCIAATAQGYTLYDKQGQALERVDSVLFTPPAPQTAELLAASQLNEAVRDVLLQALQSISYRRCLSVALAYAYRPTVPWYALVNTDRQHPIAWLACEHEKPGHAPDTIGLLIAQMGHEFSVTHWDEAEKGTYGDQRASLPLYMAQIHEYIQVLLETSIGMPLWADMHRWRYALPQPENSASFDLLNNTGSNLYFAGDYIEGRGRIYEVIECGWRVAKLIADT
jgi:hypothetical protein